MNSAQGKEHGERLVEALESNTFPTRGSDGMSYRDLYCMPVIDSVRDLIVGDGPEVRGRHARLRDPLERGLAATTGFARLFCLNLLRFYAAERPGHLQDVERVFAEETDPEAKVAAAFQALALADCPTEVRTRFLGYIRSTTETRRAFLSLCDRYYDCGEGAWAAITERWRSPKYPAKELYELYGELTGHALPR